MNPEAEDLTFAPNQAGFAVRVVDVAEARAELEAKGVEFIAELLVSRRFLVDDVR